MGIEKLNSMTGGLARFFKWYDLPEPWHWNPPAGIRLIDVRTIEELDHHAEAWSDLYSQTEVLTPMLSFPWIRAFLKHQVKPPEQWLCLLAYENDRLTGTMPLKSSYSFGLKVKGFSLQFFKLPFHYAHTSSTDCLTLPGHEDLFGLFMDYLNSIPCKIPCLSIKHVPEHSTSVRFLNSRKHKLEFVQKTAGTEAYLPLPNNPDDFVFSLSRKFRQNLRRAERELQKLPEVRYRLFDTDHASARENGDRFLDLEPRNWKGVRGTSVRDYPGSAKTFIDAAEGLCVQNRMAFCFLESAGRPVAAHYSMIGGRTLYILKMAYDEEFKPCSPGNLLMYRVILQAITSGRFSEINFFSDPPILTRWNVHHRPIWHLIVFPKIPVLSTLFRLLIDSGKVHTFELNR